MMHSAHIVLAPDTALQRRQTCAQHSRAVAEIARVALMPCGLGESGYLAGLLHDCGKFTDEFDAYLESAVRGEAVKRGSVIHSFAGVRYLLEKFHSHDGSMPFSDISAETIAASIGSHHGLFDLWDAHRRNGFDHRLVRQPAYDDRATRAFHAECAEPQEIRALFQSADAEMLRLYTDGIVPSVQNETEAYFALGLLARLITSAIIDADRTDTRCFMQNIPHPAPPSPKWEVCAAQINAHVAAFPQDTPIQKARRDFSEHCALAAE